MGGCFVADRTPGWYIDAVTESVKQLVSHTRKAETTVEGLIETLSDRSVPGMEDLTDQEFCTAVTTSLAVAVRLLADS